MANENQNTLASIAGEVISSGSTGDVTDTGGALDTQNTQAGAESAAPAAPQTPPAPTNPELSAPEFWQPQAREAWKALHGYQDGYAHLKTLHDQFGRTHGFLTQAQQRAAELERRHQPLQEFLTPYRQQWAQQGMDEVSGLRQIMSWRDALMENPQETILAMAQEFGVDLQQALEAQPWVDPHTQALEARLSAFERKEQEAQRAREAQEQEQRRAQQEFFMQRVDEFAATLGPDGKPLYPYLDLNVLQDMGLAYSRGLAQTPDEAYKIAMRWHPEGQKQLAKEAEAKAIEEAKAAAAKTAQIVGASGKDRTPIDRGAAGGKVSLRDAARAVINGN